MTKKELQGLKDGTLLYNTHTEGRIVTDCGVKCIEIYIPICGMSNDAREFDDRPQYWDVIEE